MLLSAGESRRYRETSDRGHSGNFFCNVAKIKICRRIEAETCGRHRQASTSKNILHKLFKKVVTSLLKDAIVFG
jgi:hypothetical protein